ncbi:MAG: hypothetical protein ACRDP7_44985 [Trebonia sp.]
MSLSAHERQELDLIEDEIAGSDPGLASLLAAFARLAAGEELPAREQVRAARRPHGRRRLLRLPRASRRAVDPAVRLGLAAVLLWLAVSVALIVSVLVISRGDHWKGCASAITCAGQAPAHTSRPAGPVPPVVGL